MVAGRKVVQIAATPSDSEHWGSLYALCDDGSVFRRDYPPYGSSSDWQEERPVPQVDARVEELLRQLIMPWSEFSDEQLDRREMFDHHFRKAIKDARRLLGQ